MSCKNFEPENSTECSYFFQYYNVIGIKKKTASISFSTLGYQSFSVKTFHMAITLAWSSSSYSFYVFFCGMLITRYCTQHCCCYSTTL